MFQVIPGERGEMKGREGEVTNPEGTLSPAAPHPSIR